MKSLVRKLENYCKSLMRLAKYWYKIKVGGCNSFKVCVKGHSITIHGSCFNQFSTYIHTFSGFEVY